MPPPPDGGGRLSPEAALDALVNAFPDVGFILTGEGEYVEVLAGPQSESLLYDDPEALLGRTVEEVFDDDATGRIQAAIDSALYGGVQSVRYSIGLAGERHWFDARVAPVRDCEDEHVVFVARDVTERERTRRQLVRQQGYLREMIDALDDVFYVLDTDGNLVDWNRAVQRVTGYDADDLSECAVYDVFGGGAGSRLQAFVDEVLARGAARRVTVVTTRSGEQLRYEFVASLFEDPNGENLIVGIGRDVTERYERQQQVRTFGRILRHNVRNKMTVIDCTVEYLRREADGAIDPADETVDSAFERVQSASRELEALAEKAYDATDLLLERSDRTTVQIGRIAAATVDEFQADYPEATVAFEGDREATVRAIPEIENALIELVDNAIRHADSDTPTARVSVERECESVVLLIADDGPGLPDHEANVITEEEEMSDVYHVSGMGLWLARWIVRRSGGTVTLVDRNRSGTTFRIELPPADA
ncbi:MAG: PAS domain-containing protein [Haloarculaceae archaeon]